MAFSLDECRAFEELGHGDPQQGFEIAIMLTSGISQPPLAPSKYPYWTKRCGTKMRIEDMDDGHLANSLAMVKRNNKRGLLDDDIKHLTAEVNARRPSLWKRIFG